LSELAKAVSSEVDARASILFADRIRHEYEEYREEMRVVQRKLLAGSISGYVLGGVAFATGTLGIAGVFGAAIGTQLTALGYAVDRRRSLERKPLGVLLKLGKTQSRR
jgi:hypothetical protein